MDTEQAVDYIKCAKELNELSSLLMQQATSEKKRLKNKISEQTGISLYWLWRLTTEYLDEVKLKKAIDKHEAEEDK
tara:strand:+ start:519 stop:746 length:228 start_codon:yes stop_codon:yes gene_type:complete